MSTTLVPTRPVPVTPTRPRTLSPPEVGRRVLRGIKYLDKVRPGWEQLINPAKIDLLDNRKCILGQAFGHVSYGVPESRLGRIRWGIWGWRRGFITISNQIHHEWRDYVIYRRMVTS